MQISCWMKSLHPTSLIVLSSKLLFNNQIEIMVFPHLECTFCQLANVLRSPRHDDRYISQRQTSNRKTKQNKKNNNNNKATSREKEITIFYYFKCWRLLSNKSQGVLLPMWRKMHSGRRGRGLTDWLTDCLIVWLTGWMSRVFNKRSHRRGGRGDDVTGHVRANGALQRVTADSKVHFTLRALLKPFCQILNILAICMNVGLYSSHRGRYKTIKHHDGFHI